MELENDLFAQRRLRSACPSARSDQSLRGPHEGAFCPWLHTERTAKTLIKLGGDAQVDPSLRMAHRSFYRFHNAPAHMCVKRR